MTGMDWTDTAAGLTVTRAQSPLIAETEGQLAENPEVSDPKPAEDLLFDLSDHAPHAPAEDRTKLIAFYLPQFHPIPENDRAWGKGFTEWTNVTRAKPFFEEHHQPQLPGELGFYDLRVPEVMEQQVKLAKEHGISGFCYYYYWFDGRRLLEKPLEMMLSSKRIDMPFCLCWANENWTRRWDGSDDEVIVSQNVSPESWPRFIDALMPYMEDERYIRINGRPLLLVYRPDIIPNLRKSVQMWRDLAGERGLDQFIAACLTFGFDNPLRFGFDAGVEFPPHGTVASEMTHKIKWSEPYEGQAYSYSEVVTRELRKPEKPYKVFRTAMTSWDNTPRCGAKGRLYHGATPELFEAWLSALLIRAQRRHEAGERLVFINAWNEWAEGAHLEPDQKFGRQWLTACARAARASSVRYGQRMVDEILRELDGELIPGNSGPSSIQLGELLQAQEERIRSLQAVNTALSKFYLDWLDTSGFRNSVSLVPAARLKGVESNSSMPVRGAIDYPLGAMVCCNRGHPLQIAGWICPERPVEPAMLRCLVSLAPADPHLELLYTQGAYCLPRPDVAKALPGLPAENARVSGFDFSIDLRSVEPGEYTVLIGLADECGVSYMQASLRLAVL